MLSPEPRCCWFARALGLRVGCRGSQKPLRSLDRAAHQLHHIDNLACLVRCNRALHTSFRVLTSSVQSSTVGRLVGMLSGRIPSFFDSGRGRANNSGVLGQGQASQHAPSPWRRQRRSHITWAVGSPDAIFVSIHPFDCSVTLSCRAGRQHNSSCSHDSWRKPVLLLKGRQHRLCSSQRYVDARQT